MEKRVDFGKSNEHLRTLGRISCAKKIAGSKDKSKGDHLRKIFELRRSYPTSAKKKRHVKRGIYGPLYRTKFEEVRELYLL